MPPDSTAPRTARSLHDMSQNSVLPHILRNILRLISIISNALKSPVRNCVSENFLRNRKKSKVAPSYSEAGRTLAAKEDAHNLLLGKNYPIDSFEAT